ncbi:hypothetical protein V6D99_21785, partial [Providencia stuartii]
WHTQNQLIRCFTPSGDVWRYTYDAFGRRLSKTKTVDSEKYNAHPAFPVLKPRVTAWYYLWSGDQMVEEAPVYADGTVAYDAGIQWLYQPGAITPTARYQKGQLHYVVTDHQGTPREIFTEKGIASWAGRLNTWGQMVFWQSHDGRADNDPNYTECHFRFAGQYEDHETTGFIDPLGLCGTSLLDRIVNDANKVASPGGEITVRQAEILRGNLPVVQRRSVFQNQMARKEFVKNQNYLIKQWELNTGRTWPTSATPHHIIPLESGGANKWWNLMPTNGTLPNHSLPGIPGPHAAGGTLRTTIQ